MRRRLLICAVLSVLPLAGCTSTPDAPEPKPVVPAPAPPLTLVAFDSCDKLLTELRAAAMRSLTAYGYFGAQPMPLAAEAGAMKADSGSMRAMDAAVPAPAATSFSGTNVHEQGVDEPDVVKTDGRRIVTVSGGVLHVIDAATRTETGRLTLGLGGGAPLLLAGDRALVLGNGSMTAIDQVGPKVRDPGPQIGYPGSELILVDLAGTPRVISRYRGDGRVVDARQTGNVARVVLGSNPRIVFPYNATGSEKSQLQRNKQVVNRTKVEAWLPQWEVTTGASTTSGHVDCGSVSRPASFSGASMLTVLTFDLTAPALTDGNPVSVVADGDIVYGTTDSLYIANDQRWRIDSMAGKAAPDTEIFKFALTEGEKPRFEASGAVPGMLLNQYSMSEWDGNLRVATTDLGSRSSAVRVLAPRGTKLTQVGEIDGLGKGEQIYAVRFLGPRGYVVTFRQTDPLFSLDLSDPSRPRLAGELKISGYSAHLQPVGDDLLVGVGQEASAQGVRNGVLISLFDVANPADPRRLAKYVVPDSTSEAEFDPHALLWWPATNLLVLPISGNGVLGLRVQNGAIAPVGALNGQAISRSLVIGDQLWTLGDSGLGVAELSTLDQIGFVSFG
ncbi:beta-propeller domain-containing protein [Paractinoplanes globisporus]|uniref:Beta-propeller domain-containing protein n=1 Tax=Paractinoplanes globisporus TaxID=113565 RepID=A0ABW6WSJ9_9ACTN|nr:beta-propeller domain-containing protein [Actinoplanes globisporus]